jgi:hypothetical protein
MRSLQLSVFRLGLLENWDVGVGVFPEGEEVLVSLPRPFRVAQQEADFRSDAGTGTQGRQDRRQAES